MPLCVICGEAAPHTCSGCKQVSYCSPEHQKVHWKAGHRSECLLLEATKAEKLRSDAAAALTKLEGRARLTTSISLLSTLCDLLELTSALAPEPPPPALPLLPVDEELLLRITTCLAQNGYHKEVGVMVQLNKAFWNDEQIWDAYKDVPGPGGRTRLMYAAKHGRVKRTGWLLGRGARVDTVASRNFSGVTALMFVAGAGHVQTATLLTQAGGDVNLRCSLGLTPLYLAFSGRHLGMVKLLLHHGADSQMRHDGRLILEEAIKKGDIEVARLLIDHGASLDGPPWKPAESALLAACMFKQAGMARLLISRGGNVNFVSVPDPKDVTKKISLLNAAISTGQFELVRLLVENGAYVTPPQNPEGPEEMQPLLLAFELDDVEMARLLLELGAPKSYARSCRCGQKAMV